MYKFLKKEFDLLVATTVVEVGIDVPNATVMIIEDAEKFGLSQLHQLRGRVGRGEHQSYCILFTKSNFQYKIKSNISTQTNGLQQLSDCEQWRRPPMGLKSHKNRFGNSCSWGYSWY
jgi:ATP-dependent DNA helicase RecG